MKIAIDTMGCDAGKSGRGSYLYYLTASLPKEDGTDYMLFGDALERYTYSDELNFVKVRTGDSLFSQKVFHKFFLNSFLKKGGADAVLYPAAARLLPSSFPLPSAAVITELLNLQIAKSGLIPHNILKKLSRVQRIIVPTNFLKNDLLGLGLDGSKISVIRNGIDHSFFYQRPLEDQSLVNVQPFAIKRPYIIYPSRISGAGKKHVELIRAFGKFKAETGLPHRLVLAGAEDSYAEEVHKAAFNSDFASDIFITGFFPHEGFPALYSGADACVFPSVQEGAGLPLIEAMASGVPVAAAKAGALPETCGEAAVLFDSDNIDEMAAAIKTVTTDAAARALLIERGLVRSKIYDWKKCAEETVRVLKEAATRSA